MLEQARQLAFAAHAKQRYGARPYTDHLKDVVTLLEPYGEQAQMLGYLHDIVEDTDVDLAAIRAQFGPFIADCVALLTDEDGPTRTERKARSHAKMAQARGEVTLSLIVKAADRLANVNACIADGRQDKLGRYIAEHPAFRAAAYRPGLCEELWERLDQAIASGEKR